MAATYIKKITQKMLCVTLVCLNGDKSSFLGFLLFVCFGFALECESSEHNCCFCLFYYYG